MEEEIRPGYTRVTDILSPYNRFEGIPKDILARKADLGTRVHEAIYMYYECIPTILTDDVIPYFDSFLEWEREAKGKGRMNEVRYYDDTLKITGCVDALIKFPEQDELVMVDWKTSATCTKQTSLSWHLQGTFYHYLLTQNDIPNIGDRFMFIQLSPKGKMPKVHEFEYSTGMMGKCSAALEIYRYYNPL